MKPVQMAFTLLGVWAWWLQVADGRRLRCSLLLQILKTTVLLKHCHQSKILKAITAQVAHNVKYRVEACRRLTGFPATRQFCLQIKARIFKFLHAAPLTSWFLNTRKQAKLSPQRRTSFPQKAMRKTLQISGTHWQTVFCLNKWRLTVGLWPHVLSVVLVSPLQIDFSY